MRILQICNKPAFPPIDGGAIGINNVTVGFLANGHSVKILSVNTPKHFVKREELPEEYLKKTQIEFVFINTEINVFSAFLNLFTSNSYHISRFYSKDFEEKLIEILLLQQFDLIQIETIFLHNYIATIRRFSRAKIVLRAPNVEYIIWERIALEENNPIKKWYLNLLSNRLKREELACIHKFDALYTVTEQDRLFFVNTGFKGKTAFIPTGLDVTKQINQLQLEEENESIFFIGALDWIPNQEGIFWFVKEVFPVLLKKFPHLKFYIAGRRPHQKILELHSENIKVIGEVEDAANYMQSKGIMIVPLFSGSGMRVKIIEGMMLSKAIVTTSIGIEGIEHIAGENILIADKKETFAQHILQLLEDKNFYLGIKTKAKIFVEQNYSAEILDRKLGEFIVDII